MKLEFSEDDIKQIIIDAARALCPSIDWTTVEIDTSYSYIRKVVVSCDEKTVATLEVVNG